MRVKRGLMLCVAATLAGCDGELGGEWEGEEGEREISALKTVHLYYEGSCAFLRKCSSWSVGGVVHFGCGGTDCSDGVPFLAAPSAAYCGKTATVCTGSRCTTARVRDISNIHAWEGSEAVFHNLGLAHSISGCGGSGGATVTLSFGTPGVGAACVVNGVHGTCKLVSSCKGKSTPGHCSGPSAVQCCT
jgi:hypothetical protein